MIKFINEPKNIGISLSCDFQNIFYGRMLKRKAVILIYFVHFCHRKGHVINRILHSWSFNMKFMNSLGKFGILRAKAPKIPNLPNEFHKFHINDQNVRSSIYKTLIFFIFLLKT